MENDKGTTEIDYKTEIEIEIKTETYTETEEKSEDTLVVTENKKNDPDDNDLLIEDFPYEILNDFDNSIVEYVSEEIRKMNGFPMNEDQVATNNAQPQENGAVGGVKPNKDDRITAQTLAPATNSIDINDEGAAGLYAQAYASAMRRVDINESDSGQYKKLIVPNSSLVTINDEGAAGLYAQTLAPATGRMKATLENIHN